MSKGGRFTGWAQALLSKVSSLGGQCLAASPWMPGGMESCPVGQGMRVRDVEYLCLSIHRNISTAMATLKWLR